MKKRYLYVCALAACLLAACGKRLPKDVIATGEMESILYDYHLTNAMQSTVPGSDNAKKEAMRRYLFAKHGVTEEQFDSSMVWYTRHPEELAKIYTHLQERFKGESDHVAQLLASRDEGMTLSVPGDTVDMWNGDAYYRLQAQEPLHQMLTFTMKADSNFQANDAIRWTAQYAFGKDAHAVLRMGLSVIYENDSVSGEVKNVTRSGLKEIYIPQDSAYSIRAIHGFIYMPNSSKQADVLVHDLTLMRYHVPFDSTKLQRPKVDSLQTAGNTTGDSLMLRTDSLPQVPAQPQRLSPDQLKRQPNQIRRNPNSTAGRSTGTVRRSAGTTARPTTNPPSTTRPSTQRPSTQRPATKLPANNSSSNRHVQ
jgi:hypothetical protein